MTYRNDELRSEKCIKRHIGRLHAVRLMFSWGPDAVLPIAEDLKKQLEQLIKMCNEKNHLRDLGY